MREEHGLQTFCPPMQIALTRLQEKHLTQTSLRTEIRSAWPKFHEPWARSATSWFVTVTSMR